MYGEKKSDEHKKKGFTIKHFMNNNHWKTKCTKKKRFTVISLT